MSDWKTLSSEEVYETPWIRVRRDKILNHNGKPMTYSVIELQNPSVYIIATDLRGRIFVQNNYRYTLSRYVWAIPAGHAESNNFLKDAKRELQEEAGLASDDWTDLGELYQAAGVGNLPIRLFLARKTYNTDAKRDELEEITKQRFVDLSEIESMARSGDFRDASVLGALYLAKLHGL